jgi:ABC-type sulfate transport system permease component
MKKSYVIWLADYAAGIVAALCLGLVLLLIVGWLDVFGSHPILGTVLTVLGVLIIAMLIRAVPYVRRRADARREESEESLSDLLRELKRVRTEREMREKQEKLRARRR